MGLFNRHKISTFFLLIYIFWIIFVINWFKSGSSSYPHSCGAANGGLIMLTFLIIAIYSLILIVKIIIAKEQKRSDFFKIFGLIYVLPIILILGSFLF
jgi:hypothetical protein